MPIVSGTFTAQGQTSAAIAATKAEIRLKFAGTATVALNRRMADNTWISIPGTNPTLPATATCVIVYESPVLAVLQLECTAYTNNVTYEIETN